MSSRGKGARGSHSVQPSPVHGFGQFLVHTQDIIGGENLGYRPMLEVDHNAVPIHIAEKAWHNIQVIWMTLPDTRTPIWSGSTPTMRQMWVTMGHRVLMTHIVGLLVPCRESSLKTLLHECYVIERFKQ
jgi:hypothetical protein